MTATHFFRIDPQKVIYEVIDGEAIIIQLELGNYYSLAGSGPEILELLGSGHSTDAICDVLSERHSVDRNEIDGAVANLIDQLVSERLLESNGDSPPAAAARARAPVPAQGTEGFRVPVLEKYTDMQDFLLVDPIHGVGEDGWPSPKPE